MNRRLTAQLLDTTIATAIDAALSRGASDLRAEVLTVDTGAHTLTADLLGVTLRDVPYSTAFTPAPGDTAWLLHQGARVTCYGIS